MISPEVTSLFKYCPIGKNQLSALAQKKIWYSKPEAFNDPFDTRYYVKERRYTHVLNSDSHNRKEILDEEMHYLMPSQKKSLDKSVEEFKAGIENLGILSLARSHTNLLMWSHYAAEHKGMCLEFDRTESSLLADYESTQPIRYIDNYPSLNPISILNEDESDILSIKKRILYSKSKDWEYEQEWRHILDSGNKLFPWPASLKSVYFGCKVLDADIHLVKSVIADSNVKFFRGKQYINKYGLFFDSE